MGELRRVMVLLQFITVRGVLAMDEKILEGYNTEEGCILAYVRRSDSNIFRKYEKPGRHHHALIF